MSPELERIRGYLQTQAAKLSVPELVEKVRSDMEQVRAALESVPSGRLGERPAQGEWSANEVAAHLLAWGEGVGAGIRRVLDGGGAPGVIPDQILPTDAAQTATEWWEQLKVQREALLGRVARASGDESPEIRWGHPMFGDLTWREWVLFLRIHDVDHTRQIAGIVEALPARA
ncbi:MAG: DinB family protein [Dehalococcoidia bacterium]